MIKNLLFLLLLVLCQSCSYTRYPITDDMKILQSKQNFTTARSYQGLPLESGQIVVSESGNEYSLLFSLFPEQYSTHIHAGILIVEDDQPYVYEALGNISLLFSQHPTDDISGHITRRPLDRFVSYENYTSIYKLPNDVDKTKVIAFARKHYKNKTPFDPYTNTEDHNGFYCTEFVALALNAGGSNISALSPYRSNSSITKARRWLKFLSKQVYIADALVQPENHIITLSTRLNSRQLKLYILSRLELHRRFTNDQRLGNLFKWTGLRIMLRQPVLTFQQQALELFSSSKQEPSWEEAHQAVTTLAEQSFSHFPVNQQNPIDVNLINYHLIKSQ